MVRSPVPLGKAQRNNAPGQMFKCPAQPPQSFQPDEGKLHPSLRESFL
jgi:hypothetical protein